MMKILRTLAFATAIGLTATLGAVAAAPSPAEAATPVLRKGVTLAGYAIAAIPLLILFIVANRTFVDGAVALNGPKR